MDVHKTLVIGLGSTGANAVERLASAVTWELGDIDRAPWLEYLCLETNAGETSDLPHVRGQDFLVMGVERSEFAMMVAEPSQFDAVNGLSRWIDVPTVRKLPDGSVQAGAGNIRMVGRLAFLHRENFESIKQAVAQRLDRLRALSERDATIARGPLQDGSEPPVRFAGPGVQVYVVGTLCGGTASGIAADVGFFVRSMLHDGESVTSMLTLPRPDLTAAFAPHAERYKTNAYHALVELNHYHLPDRGDEAAVLFPDGTRSRVGQFPFDLTYLLMPKTLGDEAEAQVNQALADRLFLHVFVPQTNTASRAIDAVPFGASSDGETTFADRDHRAHVFCTFGLSVVDYPVQRVMEACQAKLLEETLARALTRSVDDAVRDGLVARLGLGWDELVDDLYAVDDSLERVLVQERRAIADLARRDPDAAVDRFERLRRAFQADTDGNDALLSRGGVTRALRSRRDAVVARVMGRVSRVCADAVRDPALGIPVLTQVVSEARRFVSDLLGHVKDVHGHFEIDETAARVAAYGRHPLLTLLGVSGAAAREARLELERELGRSIEVLKRQGARHALVGEARFQGDGGVRGVLTDVQWRLEQVARRLGSLESRLLDVRGSAQMRYQRIEGATPANGSTLYQRTRANSGSVHEAYERALTNAAGVVGVDRETARRLAGQRLLDELSGVADTLVEEGSDARGTWLDAGFVRGGGVPALEAGLRSHLDAHALAPFRAVALTSVLDLLEPPAMTETKADQVLTGAAERSMPFLWVDQARATRHGRSPVAAASFALVPGDGATAERVWARISRSMSGKRERVLGHEPHRVVMIQEQYRFPLSGVPLVTGAPGVEHVLAAAACRDFPTFWSRADVAWTKVTDSEIAALQRAEDLLAVALLLGVAEVRGAAITLPWEREFGVGPTRRLRASFRHAARQIAAQGRDLDGAPLDGAPTRLHQEIMASMRRAFDEAKGTHDQSFELFAVARLDALVTAAPVIPLMDMPRGDRLVTLNQRFVARESAWFDALQQLHPIADSLKAALWRTKGDALNHSSELVAPSDGYYCPACGGSIGGDEREATLNGWRCFAHPELHNRRTQFGDAWALAEAV